MNRPLTDKPRYIKVHDADNVAIVVNDQGLPVGSRFDDGLKLTEHVPQGHKVALSDIALHGAIVRYGEVIGTALRPIARGSWIVESLVVLPAAPPLASLPLANNVPPPLPPLEGYTFEGYRNADGSVGTRNLLGITTSVHCVAGVVDYVVQLIERDIVRLQDKRHVGFGAMVDEILQVAERHLKKLNQRQRETCPASARALDTQCGGSDAFSGVTANPAIGFASELLVRCDATGCSRK